MDAATLDPVKASDHLKRLGVLLVRGDHAVRTAIASYVDHLDTLGYWQQGVPRGGGLWQFQTEGQFRFPLHEILQQRFYPMLRGYTGADVLLSSAGTIGTLRTVSAQQPGLIPFHQDLSPVGVRNSLTAWFAIDPDGIGTEGPGLRFIASLTGRRRHLIDHKVNAETGSHAIPAAKLRENEFFWTPEMKPGDIMFFDPYSPHASLGTSEMSKPRTSVDVRIMAFEADQNRLYRQSPGFGSILFDETSMIAPSAVLEGNLFEYDTSGASAAVADAWARDG